jgi:hypothetical protein
MLLLAIVTSPYIGPPFERNGVALAVRLISGVVSASDRQRTVWEITMSEQPAAQNPDSGTSAHTRTGRWIAHLVPDIPHLARRFPWTVAVLVPFAVVVATSDATLALLNHQGPPLQLVNSSDSAVMGLMALALGLTGIALASEGGHWTAVKRHGASALWSLLCALAIAGAISRWSWCLPNLFMLLGGSFLALLAGAAWGRPADAALWSVLRTLGLIAAAILVSWLVPGLINGMLGDGNVPFVQLPAGLRLVVIGLVPLFLLHWLPTGRDDGDATKYAGLVVDRFLVPIGLLAVIIASIGLLGATVSGRLTWQSLPGPTLLLAMVTLLYLAAAPMLGDASFTTTVLRRAFPVLAAVPLVMMGYLWFEILLRPAPPHYPGSTFIGTEWYWISTLGAVTAATALAAMLRPAWRDVRLALAAASGFLILASIGPWGEQATAARQARARIAAALTEAEWLVNGRLVPGRPIALGTPQAALLMTAIPELERIDRLASIGPWFRGLPNDPFAAFPNAVEHGQPGFLVPHVLAALGLGRPAERPPPRPGSTSVVVNSTNANQPIVPIPGYTRIAGPVRIGGHPAPIVAPAPPGHPIQVSVHKLGDTLSVESAGTSLQIKESGASTSGVVTVAIDLRPLLVRLVEETRARTAQNAKQQLGPQPPGTEPGDIRLPPRPQFHPPQLVEAASGPLKAALLITQLNATLGPAPDYQLHSFQGQAWLLLGPSAPEKSPDAVGKQ